MAMPGHQGPPARPPAGSEQAARPLQASAWPGTQSLVSTHTQRLRAELGKPAGPGTEQGPPHRETRGSFCSLYTSTLQSPACSAVTIQASQSR